MFFVFQVSKQKQAPIKNIGDDAYFLFKSSMDRSDLDRFCNKASGFITNIRTVSAKSVPESEGMRFSDGALHVNLDYFGKHEGNAVEFTRQAINAVLRAFTKKYAWRPGYTNFDDDYAFLEGIKGRLWWRAVQRDESLTLAGNVKISKTDHARYLNLRYDKPLIHLHEEVFANAYAAYLRGVRAGEIKPGLFVIADYTLPNTGKRLYVVDFSNPDQLKVLDAMTVSHGSGSDNGGWVQSLSNMPESRQSSKGLYSFKSWEWRTDKDFRGVVWRLEGCDLADFKALERGILLHVAHGKLSFGCFGVNPQAAAAVALPVASNLISSPSQANQDPYSAYFSVWKKVGLYVYFDKNVQNERKKEWREGKRR